MKQTIMHGWADLALGSQCGEGDQETLMHGRADLALGSQGRFGPQEPVWRW